MYDKILKENIDAVIPALMQKLLRIDAVRTENLPGQLQHTKEREPDALKLVIDRTGQTFILHIEFQVKDEPQMVFRMADYAVMLGREYETVDDFRQYVIHLGSKKPTMKITKRIGKNLFEYDLLWIRDVDYTQFVRAESPGEVLMGILADFGQTPKEQVIVEIITRLERTIPDDLTLGKHLNQLRVLGHLRNLEALIDTVMLRASDFFKEERDPLFKRGLERGLERAQKIKKDLVRNLLIMSDMT
ncbi:MAG: hypothetical protein EOO88_59870, partial [Pedobacter sp.]